MFLFPDGLVQVSEGLCRQGAGFVRPDMDLNCLTWAHRSADAASDAPGFFRDRRPCFDFHRVNRADIRAFPATHA